MITLNSLHREEEPKWFPYRQVENVYTVITPLVAKKGHLLTNLKTLFITDRHVGENSLGKVSVVLLNTVYYKKRDSPLTQPLVMPNFSTIVYEHLEMKMNSI